MPDLGPKILRRLAFASRPPLRSTIRAGAVALTPLAEAGKASPLSRRLVIASTDTAQIKSWWRRHPSNNT